MQENRRIAKRPAGLALEAGPEFIDAVNDAAALGYTVWFIREDWNGSWSAALTDPNSNSATLGDSMSCVRQGRTPGAAIRAVIAQFKPTAKEADYTKLIERIRALDPLGAPVVLSMETVRRLEDAFERLTAAFAASAVQDDDL